MTTILRNVTDTLHITRPNWDQIEGDWKWFKGKVQQQWGKLTDDDMDVVNGKRTELLGVLQTRMDTTRKKASARSTTGSTSFE